jgi:transglutaminase-like putative cysteine protease
MKLHITHSTEYSYTEPVRLNPHVLRLRPRSTSRQKVWSFALTVSPDPVHTVVLDSVDDSLCHRLYFIGNTGTLQIETESVVDAKPSLVPEDLHLYSTTAMLPMVYPDAVFHGLTSFFELVPNAVQTWKYADAVANGVHYQTDHFLITLARAMNREFTQEYRQFGWPLEPDETLRQKSGSCRDLAWFYVTCCRYFGLAARFVSGYVYDDAKSDDGGELHAWAEVYLLGYGWVGYDPSYACQVGEQHIKLCAGSVPQLCSPVDGTFLGPASSSLTTRVLIRPI